MPRSTNQQASARPALARIAAGHPRILAAVVLGLLTYLLLGDRVAPSTRTVLAWDTGALAMLLLAALLCYRADSDAQMAQHAERQQEGEWTMFGVALAAIAFSFVALVNELSDVKGLAPGPRNAHVALVGFTLMLSWLVTQILFALRYAHEFYTPAAGAPGAGPSGGLDFPGETRPDYWDFVYFALVLGMTFQVSDVQITSRTLRRLAAAHGLVGFLFNTVIVALTVNIAAGLV